MRTHLRRMLRCEPLEARLLLFSPSGYSWANTDISFSFMPDGTSNEGTPTALFADLNQIADEAVWQREFARSLQTWANVSTLNFFEVADDGTASDVSILGGQGDSRFGDLRLGTQDLPSYLAWAYYPSNSYTIGGDISLSRSYSFGIGSNYDLYSVFLHEAGHGLGLGHSAGTVMNSSYSGIWTGLTADDIAGIQSIYGARSEDVFDAAQSNNDSATASSLALGSDGSVSVDADLTNMADVDFFRVAAPDNATGSLAISLPSGVSLLAPEVQIYNQAGELLQSSGGAYGAAVSLDVTSVAPGDVFYVSVDGATTDVFGMGAYRLDVQFGVGTVDEGGGGGDTGDSVAPDARESNDTLATATNLGRTNSFVESNLTLHSAGDVDVFSFAARKQGTFNITTTFTDTTLTTLRLLDSSGNVLSSSTNGSASITLGNNQQIYVEVFSPTGDLGVYELAAQKSGSGGSGGSDGTGGTGGSKGGKSGKNKMAPTPDPYFANEMDAMLHHDHDHDQRDHAMESDSAPLRRGELGFANVHVTNNGRQAATSRRSGESSDLTRRNTETPRWSRSGDLPTDPSTASSQRRRDAAFALLGELNDASGDWLADLDF